MNILVFGSNYITSAILKTLLYLPDTKLIVIDRKDPHYVLNQEFLDGVNALSTTTPDLKKNFEYTRGFELHPDDPLSFLFLNPVTDTVKLYEELVKLDTIDAVVDCGMMFDPLYCENNLIDTVNTNTTYPTAVLSMLSKMSTTPKLYINLSSGLVYGKQPLSKLPLKEDTMPNPAGMRAGSLLARESIVSSLAQGFDIPFVTLRLGNAIGYYTPPENVINQIVKWQLLKQPLVIQGDGTQARDFFDLKDLSLVIHRILLNVFDKPLPRVPQNQQSETDEKKKRLTGFEYVEMIKNQVYNIAGHHSEKEGPFTLITLDRFIQNALGRVVIPESQGKIIIKNSRTKNVPWRVSEHIEKGLVLQMDTNKAIEMLDYDPTYNLLDTVKAEVIPYMAENFLGYDEEKMKDLKKILKLE